MLEGNIFFNGPRAGINFNDGFGGNSTIRKNLVFNTCRESGDHGMIIQHLFILFKINVLMVIFMHFRSIQLMGSTSLCNKG